MTNQLHEFQPGVFARLHEERTVEGRRWVYCDVGWVRTPPSTRGHEAPPAELQTRRSSGSPDYGTYLRPRLGGAS